MGKDTLIPVQIASAAWPALAGELPTHLLTVFTMKHHGAGRQAARAYLSPDDARLVKMAALRAERAALKGGGRHGHKVANACERLVLRMEADMRVQGIEP